MHDLHTSFRSLGKHVTFDSTMRLFADLCSGSVSTPLAPDISNSCIHKWARQTSGPYLNLRGCSSSSLTSLSKNMAFRSSHASKPKFAGFFSSYLLRRSIANFSIASWPHMTANHLHALTLCNLSRRRKARSVTTNFHVLAIGE